ncbi:hypothetical protein [Nocardia sp. NBC_00881]
MVRMTRRPRCGDCPVADIP